MAFSDHVATLIANPSNPCLSPAIAEECRIATGASGVYFLADGIACDLPLPDTSVAVEIHLKKILSAHSIDFVVQHADHRRKKVLIADMDSTMIEQECIDELAREAGVGNQVSEITARAMRGELEFEQALRKRTLLLKGQPVGIIQNVLLSKISFTPGAHELIATMKANGAYCALVSGGFTQFTSHVAKALGFDEQRANKFEFSNDTFTGKIIPPILGPEAKAKAINDICHTRDLSPDNFLAVGDGANDLPMIKLAGSGVALHAKPIVAAIKQKFVLTMVI